MMTKRWEQNNTVFTSYMAFIACVMALFAAPACSEHNKEKAASEAEQKNWATPKLTLLAQLPEKDAPKMILLDTAPKPSVMIPQNRPVRPGFETTGKTKFQPDFSNKISNATLIDKTKGIGFFETFTTDDGLSLDQVYCSYKDNRGNLWFGTNGGGVSKYDGKSFTNYTTAHGLATNVIWCITQDHNGNFWFGTDGGGVSKYDGQSFTNYTTAQGLPDNIVFTIIEDKKNNLWFGTLKGGASKFDGKSFSNYSVREGLSSNAVKQILQDGKGNLWFATLGGGVSKYDGKIFTTYTTKEGLIGNKVWSVAEDDSGNIWFGAAGKGVSKFNGTAFINYSLFNEAAGDAVLCIEKDKNGALWLGTQSSGVLKYNGTMFTSYSTANGLANNHIKSVTQDEKGNLWFGSFGNGVCKFAGNSFVNFTTVQGLSSNIIYSMEEANDGGLWLGTSGGGVCQYDGKQFKNFTKADGLARDEIYCVLNDRAGNLWFGTSGGGVSRYDGQSFTTYTTLQGLANNVVFSIAEDKQGNLWFGTSGGGVSKYDGRSFTTYTTLQGLANNVVFSIAEDKQGNLWFGTFGGGVSKFDGIGFTNYTTEQGLLDNVVWTVTQDRNGNLWIGTQHGLSLMPKDGNKIAGVNLKTENQLPLFTSFTTRDGLPNDFITQVVQGDGEKLYIGTNLGMCELLPAKNSSSGKGWVTGRVFNTQHGYPVKDVNAGLHAMFKDSDGIIWIGTGSDKTGLVRFEPGALGNDNGKAPGLYINRVKINNKAVSWRSIDASRQQDDSAGNSGVYMDEVTVNGRKLTNIERDSVRTRFANIKFDGITKWEALPENLVLPYYFNNVSFEFGAIETSQNFLVNYKYFLEGYDKEWSPASHGTSASFGNMNDGQYKFMVKAQSAEGVWGEPITYSFTVLSPWWRTWWMLTLYALLVIGAIILFIRWRHQRIIYQKKNIRA